MRHFEDILLILAFAVVVGTLLEPLVLPFWGTVALCGPIGVVFGWHSSRINDKLLPWRP